MCRILALVAALSLTTLTACQARPNTRSSQSEANTDESTVSFEIRDFKQERSDSSFRGRATVVTRDPRLQSGQAVLVIQQTIPGPHSLWDEVGGNYQTIYLKDGVGVIETFASATKEGQPPNFKWEAVGWSRLNRATVVIDAQPSQTKPVTGATEAGR